MGIGNSKLLHHYTMPLQLVSALYRQRVRSYRKKTLWGGGRHPPPPLGRRGLISLRNNLLEFCKGSEIAPPHSTLSSPRGGVSSLLFPGSQAMVDCTVHMQRLDDRVCV